MADLYKERYGAKYFEHIGALWDDKLQNRELQ